VSGFVSIKCNFIALVPGIKIGEKGKGRERERERKGGRRERE
jgi:hypothetical protein